MAARVAAPDGTRTQLRSDESGVLSGVAAPRVGRYTIQNGSETVAELGVSPLNAQETGLAAVRELRFQELSIKAADSVLRNDKPLWTWFALAGFGLLLVEWWSFQRKPGGVAR